MLRHILHFLALFAFGLAYAAPDCDLPPPCNAQLQYSTPDGARIFWCETPDAAGYRLIVRDTAGNTLDTVYVASPLTEAIITGLAPGKYTADIATGCMQAGLVGYGSTHVTVAFKVHVIIDGVVMLISPSGGTPVGQINTTTPARTVNMGPTQPTDTIKFRIEIWQGDTQTAAFGLGFRGGETAFDDEILCKMPDGTNSSSADNGTIEVGGVALTLSRFDRRGTFRLTCSEPAGYIVKMFRL